MTPFPLGRVAVAAALGEFEKTTVFSSPKWFCWLQYTPSRVGGAIKPPGHFLRVCAAGLSSPMFLRTFWTHGRTNVVDLSIRGADLTLRLYEFHSCALCREVSNCQLFAKSHLCHLYLSCPTQGRSKGGAMFWAPKSPNNVARILSSTVNFLPSDLGFEHGGAKLVFCPRHHLTSVRPWSNLVVLKFLVAEDPFVFSMFYGPLKHIREQPLRGFGSQVKNPLSNQFM